MQNNSILEFIGEYINAGLREEISGGTVTHINFDDETLQLFITVKFDRYVDDKIIQLVRNEVKNALSINKVNIKGVFPSSAFSQSCAPLLIRVLRDNVAAANGFTENAKVYIEPDSVKFELNDGAGILKEAQADAFLEKYIQECFGINLKVKFEGESALTVDSPEYLKMQAEGVKIEIPKEEPKAPKKPQKEYDDLPISLTNAKVIYGNKIKSKPVPLNGISIEDGNVTVWGNVFGFDIRETRDGKRKIINFNITDKTNSYAVKIFEANQNCEELVKNLSNG